MILRTIINGEIILELGITNYIKTSMVRSLLMQRHIMVVNSIIDFLQSSPIPITLTMRYPEDNKEQINSIFLGVNNWNARFLRKYSIHYRQIPENMC